MFLPMPIVHSSVLTGDMRWQLLPMARSESNRTACMTRRSA